VPDFVGLNSDIATYFPAADQFVDLYSLGAKDVQSEYLSWKWNAGVTPDGKMIGFPMDTGPTALFYRADLFQRAGLPTDPPQVAASMKNWEDYFKAGTTLQQKLPHVKMLDNTNHVFTQIMAQQAKVYVTPDNHYIGQGDQVKRVWDLSAETKKLNIAAGALKG
jgi:cellobiose transport system substrate-binding protein